MKARHTNTFVPVVQWIASVLPYWRTRTALEGGCLFSRKGIIFVKINFEGIGNIKKAEINFWTFRIKRAFIKIDNMYIMKPNETEKNWLVVYFRGFVKQQIYVGDIYNDW